MRGTLFETAVNALRYSRTAEGETLIAEQQAQLEKGKTYSFTYIHEGSVGVFYIDGVAALTVRIYGASGKSVMLFAENNAVEFTSLRQYTK